MEVGFCDSHSGGGFYLEQPRDQLERWTLPADNGTHLTIPWKPDRRACGLNVSSYFVDVKTSTPVLNFFMAVFFRSKAPTAYVGLPPVGQPQIPGIAQAT